jgi:predicted Fe-Mo cluster-binding NifX family protein
MKIAIASNENWSAVAGHAGQSRQWLVFDCQSGQPAAEPLRVTLTKEQLPHYFEGDGPHPLRGIQLMVAGSAGDGFFRHMAKWGTDVVLTGEADPRRALEKILAGEALADTRFDITTTLCKLRDLFSRH